MVREGVVVSINNINYYKRLRGFYPSRKGLRSLFPAPVGGETSAIQGLNIDAGSILDPDGKLIRRDAFLPLINQ